MKNKLFLLGCLLLITSTTSAQFNAYDRPSYPSQQNLPTMDEMMLAPMIKMKQYKTNMEYLNALIDWIFNLKEDQTDNQFQSEIDGYYKVLKSYYDKDLAVAGGSLKQIELKIGESIVSYNNRIKKSYGSQNTTTSTTRAYNTTNTLNIPRTENYLPRISVPHDSSNLQIFTEAFLRDCASPIGNTIGIIPKNVSVTFLSKENGYYQVRYGKYEGYVSEIFVE